MSTRYCGICEILITAVPPDIEVVLCRKCARHPVLVQAFKEGRTTLLLKQIEEHHSIATSV